MIRRTTIEIDEDLVAKAQEVLGTTGVQDTVDAALAEVVRARLRSRLAERIRTGRGIDRGERIFRASRR